MNRIQRMRASLLAASLALLAAPCVADHVVVQRMSREAEGWPLADFMLRDQQEREFTQERLIGRWTFVLLGDTHCAALCSAPLAALSGVYQRLAPSDKLRSTQVLFVSLDPARDGPADLAAYLARFDARFVGATGTAQALARLTDDLGSDASPAAAAYSGTVFLVGPDATLRARFLPPFDVPRLTAAYLKTRLGRPEVSAQ